MKGDTMRKTDRSYAATRRPTNEEFLAAKRSMLNANSPLPQGYGAIETTEEAISAAIPPAKGITLRVTIVWDNDVKNLDLERVLENMRETGAAFVLKVEQVEG
jgi:hypothetical protein